LIPWSITLTQGTEQNLPGLSVAMGVAGDIVWAEGFGWADLENRVPVTPDTRLRIGTASKALTSAAVGLLLEKDRLNLDRRFRGTCLSSRRNKPSRTRGEVQRASDASSAVDTCRFP
jgi:hypothetical protein